MSNLSIILRLENKLEDFLSNKVGKDDFSNYLINSAEALEGVGYDTILTARDFQYKFEVADFNDDDPEIESIEKVTKDFKKWIETIKNQG